MSAWNPLWDDIFRSREWGKYPKEELIRFVARHYYSAADRSAVRILDVGCGYGASTWYLAREGFSAHGLDGSAVVIRRLRERLSSEGLSASLVVGDALFLPYSSASFDCVIDLACLMCNDPHDTARILTGLIDRLKPGGRIFSVTPSQGCWGDGLGEQVAECTFRDVSDGPFAGTGTVRFSSERQIRTLYADFDLTLDQSNYRGGGATHSVSHWIIEGVKR
jgi:SAM-dependent methyltransferase